MPSPFFPTAVVFAEAEAKRTALALSVVKLFKADYVPDAGTTVAALDAVECDYDDYAPATITAWLPPTNSRYGGAEITAPTVQFTIDTEQAVANSVGGYWIETAGGALVMVKRFDDPQPMSQPGDAVKVAPNYVFPTGL